MGFSARFKFLDNVKTEIKKCNEVRNEIDTEFLQNIKLDEFQEVNFKPKFEYSFTVYCGHLFESHKHKDIWTRLIENTYDSFYDSLNKDIINSNRLDRKKYNLYKVRLHFDKNCSDILNKNEGWKSKLLKEFCDTLKNKEGWEGIKIRYLDLLDGTVAFLGTANHSCLDPQIFTFVD